MDPLKLAGYDRYSDIPNYRRHKGFWTVWLVLPIVAVFILLTGEVFYKWNDEVHTFSEANVILAMIMGALWFSSQVMALLEILSVSGLLS